MWWKSCHDRPDFIIQVDHVCHRLKGWRAGCVREVREPGVCDIDLLSCMVMWWSFSNSCIVEHLGIQMSSLNWLCISVVTSAKSCCVSSLVPRIDLMLLVSEVGMIPLRRKSKPICVEVLSCGSNQHGRAVMEEVSLSEIPESGVFL